MGKSLIDNPLANNDVVINSVTGRRFSQEAIEENKTSNEEVKEIIKEDVKTKEPLTKEDTSKINELLKDYKKEIEEEKPKKTTKTLEEQLEEVEEANKKLIEEKTKEAIDEPKIVKEVVKKETSNEKQYIKKTYLISQDNIDLIEGLALYTGKERKEVVEELLEKAINLIDPTIIEKALKEVKKSKKEEITKEIF